jgi:hypothetical protein
VGSVTYRFPPDYAFDPKRAAGAVSFADSLAVALELSPLRDVTYFVARSPEELHRIMGLDWTLPGMGHGYALPWNRLLLNGNPDFGEANRHEFTHLVLGPLLEQGRTHGAVNEGMATWLGGAMGMTFLEVMNQYAGYLRDRPGMTLDGVFAGVGPDAGVAPAGAVLVQMVFESQGHEGLMHLLTSGASNEELQAALVSLLGKDWEQIGRTWRDRVFELGGGDR